MILLGFKCPMVKGLANIYMFYAAKVQKKNAKHKIKMKIFLFFIVDSTHCKKKCFIRQTGYRIQNTVFKTVGGIVDAKKKCII